MQISVKSKIFAKRELRRLQRLYRSRELTTQRKSTTLLISATSVNLPSSLKKIILKIKFGIKSTEYVYQFYGSRGALSPNQRIIFRNAVEKIVPFFKNKPSKIKFSLFSTSISQATRAFSHLRDVRSLLKGASYQRQRNIPISNNNSNVANTNNNTVIQIIVTNIYREQHQVESQLGSFISQLNGIAFSDSEEYYLEFRPSLIFIPNSLGIKVPRRYNFKFNYSKETIFRPYINCLVTNYTIAITPYIIIVANIIHMVNIFNIELIIIN